MWRTYGDGVWDLGMFNYGVCRKKIAINEEFFVGVGFEAHPYGFIIYCSPANILIFSHGLRESSSAKIVRIS